MPGSNSRPNVSEAYEVPLSYRGDRPSAWAEGRPAIALHSEIKKISNCSHALYNNERHARLVHSTVPDPRIGNVLTTLSRDNHIASLFEMSLFTSSRMRTLTTISCAQESASHGDLPVIENSEPPQGARVLTDEQSRLTPTDANG